MQPILQVMNDALPPGDGDASMPAELPVAIIGAGPVGLAAAARLIERGLTPLIVEARATVGAHLLDVGHVRLFSPWAYNIDEAMAQQLRAAGWQPPHDLQALPLARELVEQVLRPFAALPMVESRLHLNTRVVAISRLGHDKLKTAQRQAAPFVVRTVSTDGRSGRFLARAVIDASGTWAHPNPLGAEGLPAEGERECAAAIDYGIPDVLGAARARHAGRTTLVVGAGHSAANVLIDLARLAEADTATRIVWAIRSAQVPLLLQTRSNDALPARAELGNRLAALRESGRIQLLTDFHLERIEARASRIAVIGRQQRDGQLRTIDGIDRIVAATGQRPDLTLTRELRLRLDPALESVPALAPLIDPNIHSCGTVRPHGHRELAHADEPGFYTVGVKSYGRAPTFLLATGYEQVRSVVAALAGDELAADQVQLCLPETGVCGVAPNADGAAAACCGPAPAHAPASVRVHTLVATGSNSAACMKSPAAAPARPVAQASCCG